MQWSIATAVGRMFLSSRRKNEGDCCQAHSRPVLHTLKKFYSDFTQESMEELLPGGFICRFCVRVIERFNKRFSVTWR